MPVLMTRSICWVSFETVRGSVGVVDFAGASCARASPLDAARRSWKSKKLLPVAIGSRPAKAGRPLRSQHLHHDSEFSFALFVRHFVFVERINVDLLFGGGVIVDAE